MATWKLGTIKREADGRITMKDVRDFCEEEYAEFSDAHQAMRRFSIDERLLLMVVQNHEEFRALLDSVLKQWQIEKRMDELILENLYLEVNRLLINMLASFTAYLNLTERKLKEQPAGEATFERFKKACSAAYDTDFAYRFLYKLRNFSQHYELPIGNIHAGQSLNEDGIQQYKLEITFLPDELLNNDFDSWGQPVRSELECMDEEFDVVPLLDRLIDRLMEIESVVTSVRLADIEPVMAYFEGLLQEVIGEEGMPCLFLIEGEETPENVKMEHFPFHVIEAVRAASGQLPL
jgi:hypothetical protein